MSDERFNEIPPSQNAVIWFSLVLYIWGAIEGFSGNLTLALFLHGVAWVGALLHRTF